jgi:hypothetical protein
MTVDGTVVNGVIVPDAGARLPEGARVRIQLTNPEVLAPAPDASDRAAELDILRTALADVRAGRGTPAREYLKELAENHGLPLSPGE